MNKLGLAYQNGLGVAKDPQRALQWYLKAANLGYMYAMNNLGGMYIGIPGFHKIYRSRFAGTGTPPNWGKRMP